MISSQQYRKLMRSYQQTDNLTASALRAGVERKTARKYVLEGSPGPDEPRPARHWRTRPDAFADLWPEVEVQLGREPQLEAKVLFEGLLERHGGRVTRRQRRTFERRVRAWKRQHGPEGALFFSQEHQPGERLQLDWCHATELDVHIGAQRLEHLLVHVVLPYSNWEWARVCFSESFLSLKRGLQSALFELGGVPRFCQTDQSSTATHERGRGRPGRAYNARYLGLLAHYGLQAAVIGIQQPHENGDVESSHRYLRQALDQALRLKGDRRFGSLAQYEAFMFALLRQRNGQRAPRLEQEKGALRPLPAQRLAEHEEAVVRVSREGLARVGHQAYSVPSRFAGERLRARLYETDLEFWWNDQLICRTERQRGDQGVFVDWRHVIGALQRKPGALIGWRHRAAMFPNATWRTLYEGLQARYSAGRAEREYLGILALGLEQRLEALEAAILELGAAVSLDTMRQRFCPAAPANVLALELKVDLSPYDALLAPGVEGGGEEVA
jgi:transposase